VNSFKNPSAQF